MTVLRFLQPKIKGMSNGLFANWMPTNQVEIGDYGVVRNGQFERLGSLRDYGAEFDVEDVPGTRNDLEYKDRFYIKVNAVASATAPAKQSAKISLKANGKGSFLYHLANASQRRPVNTRRFNEEVARILLASDIDFPKDGVLITEVQFADKATIIVSDEDKGELELDTSFKPVGVAYLSGAKGKISTAMSMGSFLQWIARDQTTSLIKIVIPKVVRPGGQGPGHGSMATAIEAVKDWIQEKRVGVGRLRFSCNPAIAPGTVIAFEGETQTFQVVLEDMSAEELVATIQSEEPLATTYDEPFTIAIEEEEFGEQSRSATG